MTVMKLLLDVASDPRQSASTWVCQQLPWPAFRAFLGSPSMRKNQMRLVVLKIYLLYYESSFP